MTAEVVVHIGGRAVGTVDFQLHAEHQRSMESRIAEIRGEKKKNLANIKQPLAVSQVRKAVTAPL